MVAVVAVVAMVAVVAIFSVVAVVAIFSVVAMVAHLEMWVLGLQVTLQPGLPHPLWAFWYRAFLLPLFPWHFANDKINYNWMTIATIWRPFAASSPIDIFFLDFHSLIL